MISAVMLDMQRLQAAALYPIQENSLLRRFVLYDIDVVDDDVLYKVRCGCHAQRPTARRVLTQALD